ncbi:Transcriptional regulator [Caenorhabditis elegans]|uniref:Transcriptional regulator n=1 Tax=Caenorhabditis elegans TaxID=6239 RepID=O17600_CAEEL|nr:Transcriptional regulator [Caenorhabditis elegans]CAB02778.1 Transcriptional regulator [Caenorhabditis elegans]|eukprot:NP_506708.1 Uncharacterized protein CELE_C25D7.9 [Caenorhabditis elegans]
MLVTMRVGVERWGVSVDALEKIIDSGVCPRLSSPQIVCVWPTTTQHILLVAQTNSTSVSA